MWKKEDHAFPAQTGDNSREIHASRNRRKLSTGVFIKTTAISTSVQKVEKIRNILQEYS